MADPSDNTSLSDALYGSQPPAADDAGANSDSFPSLDSDGNLTETTSVSWFQKLMEAAIGVLVGLAFVVVTGGVLFWNEGRAVQTYRSLAEGAGLVIDVANDRVDAGNDGKLIHVQGELQTTAPLVDPALGVQARGARLVRSVEMYQWKEESRTETHKRVGGGEDRTTTYSYERVWSDRKIDSSRFHQQSGHSNPEMRYSRQEVVAQDARLGAFRPGAAALTLLTADRLQPVEEADAARLKARPGSGPVQTQDGRLYLGANPSEPRIGDMKVSFMVAPLGPTSFLGQQAGPDIREYPTKAGDRLLMAQAGLLSADSMFAQAREDNRILTWILRAVPAVVMWIGFWLILRPIAVVGDLVPMIGSMLSAGAAFVAFVATIAVAPLVIAIAWFFYRPLVSVGIVVAGAALVYGLRTLAHRKKAAPAPSFLPPRTRTA